MEINWKGAFFGAGSQARVIKTQGRKLTINKGDTGDKRKTHSQRNCLEENTDWAPREKWAYY